MSFEINLPEVVKNYIKNHNIPLLDLVDKVHQLSLLEPKAAISYDIDTYSKYGVLRVLITYKKYEIQPLLFGSIKNLTLLSDYLWEKSSEIWKNSMEDCSTYGAFKKKYILNSEIIKIIERHYKDGDSILDVGCGEGSLDIDIDKTITDKIYGIDISRKSVKLIGKLLPHISKQFKYGDITSYKYGYGKKYDFVIASMLLSNIIETNLALDNLVKLVKKGGVLIITDVNPITYPALGYEMKNNIRVLHNPAKEFYSEKHICGLVKAVHHYGPWGMYKNYLETRGLITLEEYSHTISLKTFKKLLRLHCKDKIKTQSYLDRSGEVIATPPFYFLIMKNAN